MNHLTTESWGDLVTLATLSVMWWVMFSLELRRTWKWDALGRALTLLTFCLGVSYSVAALTVLVEFDVWTPPVRWAFRAALFAAGLVVIVVLALDRPKNREG